MPAIQFVYAVQQQDGGANDYWQVITPDGRVLARLYDRKLMELLKEVLEVSKH